MLLQRRLLHDLLLCGYLCLHLRLYLLQGDEVLETVRPAIVPPRCAADCCCPAAAASCACICRSMNCCSRREVGELSRCRAPLVVVS